MEARRKARRLKGPPLITLAFQFWMEGLGHRVHLLGPAPAPTYSLTAQSWPQNPRIFSRLVSIKGIKLPTLF